MFQQLWEQLTTQLAQNDLLAGGAILGAASLLIGWIRPRLAQASAYLKARFVISVLVSEEMEQYKWVCHWLHHHPYMKKARRLAFEEIEGRYQYNDYDGYSSSNTPRIRALGLAPGWHLIWQGWRPIVIDRVRDKLQMAEDDKSVRNEIHLDVIGSRKYIDQLFDEMKESYDAWNKESKGIKIYRNADHGGFKLLNKVSLRPLDSVLIPGKQQIIDDLQQFMADREWYEGLDIPWRRGYLFSGPPGCGKTSLVKGIASELKMDIYIINLAEVSGPSMSDLFNNASGLILIEDIDCVFKSRETEDKELSYLLNAIDGVSSGDGRVMIMTTNYPEKLDSALVRPGRVDLALDWGHPHQREIAQMFERFFPESTNALLFGERVEKLEVSMAIIQEYLVRYRKDMEGAFQNYQHLLEMKEARDAEANALRSIDSDPDDVGD